MRKLCYALLGGALWLAHSFALAAASGYCDANGRNSYYFWQNSMTIGDTVISTGNNGGYQFTPDAGITLQPGANQIQLNPGYRFYNYTVYWRGWLDLNGDLQFSADEQLFQASSRGALTVTATLPETLTLASSTLRISMKYGSYPAPCEIYSYGETEDLVVQLPVADSPALTDAYHLQLGSDFTVQRSGAIGDDLRWVVEKNGAVVLQRMAASELEYRYFANSSGADFRLWLEQDVAGDQQRVSNVVAYTPGTTDRYALHLSEGYQLHRSGGLGEAGNLTWVIEMDGEVVLERLATEELSYVYYRNWAGTRFRVWLKQFINGQYEVVSNTLEYQPNQTEFTLTLDQKYKLTRNGQPGDAVRWIVEQDGLVIVDRDAAAELEYRFIESIPGARYRLWLQMNIDGQDRVVSNVIEYDEPTTYPYQLALGPNYQVTRSGSTGEPLTWVVVKDGSKVLESNASNGLSFLYSGNTQGSYLELYLHQRLDGYEQRVSNIIRYEVKDFGYSLNLGPDYQLQRTGQLGEPLYWVIEENGNRVLQQDASQSLNFTYPGNTPGAAYRAWLGMEVDATFRPVSSPVYYQVQEPQPPQPPFTIALGTDYVVTRDGGLGDPLRWVVTENGMLVWSQPAAETMQFQYPDHQPHAQYRVWLEDEMSGEVLSNEVAYEYVVASTFQLTLMQDYSVERSGPVGEGLEEPLEWVLLENGMERWREDASQQPGFYFHDYIPGSQYQLWLVSMATQAVVSEVLTFTYVLPGAEYSLTLDEAAYQVTRSGQLGEPLSWIVEENGVVVNDFDAGGALDFVYQNPIQGAHYRIWLVRAGEVKPVSNIIEYDADAATHEFSISLNSDGTITRSGSVGDQLDLVFLQNGQIVAGMDASQSLVLAFPFVSSGAYEAYLIAWGGEEGGEEGSPVSNTLQINVP
ncbi:GEVED domain-containing protein [Ketobacter sp.]|uniref:GEVED domain-containing protein n=1 Tax=Ketobacter sp. TaxID=2083498 RepID=UPI000F1E4A6E|nr:GEVED domain-containing protein [Ketobacter sp.]RLT96819.1 MAG: hypothetical protein D9N14_12330 [Ketobacter sp.]